MWEISRGGRVLETDANTVEGTETTALTKLDY